MSTRSDAPPPLALKILGIVALGGFGACVGAGLATLVDSRDLPWDDAVVLVMIAALGAMAVASAIVMAMRPASVPKGCGLLQIAVLVLAAAMFAAPMYATPWISPDVVFVGVVVLMVVQSAANLMLWNKADEMLRRIMAETGALAFLACEAGLFLYAAAERMALVGPVSSWGLIGIVMGVYLLASSFAAARRGIT